MSFPGAFHRHFFVLVVHLSSPTTPHPPSRLYSELEGELSETFCFISVNMFQKLRPPIFAVNRRLHTNPPPIRLPSRLAHTPQHRSCWQYEGQLLEPRATNRYQFCLEILKKVFGHFVKMRSFYTSAIEKRGGGGGPSPDPRRTGARLIDVSVTRPCTAVYDGLHHHSDMSEEY
ncbi:hypothetical protein EV356DRAFT_160568 [Viridothelium virens]|uniref:Uncharacterized protein n=1 Tax=Viridothelium virens TaxID=1048519 RepID=A0A6A6H951_VIRVR|nr:hypothetical protein EV356DRAFT_160568 [Viridothelium virens]